MNTCVTWTEITLSGEAVHYNFVIKFCMYETIIDVCNKFIRTCTLSTNSHKSFRSSLRGYWDEWFRSPGVAIGDIPCVGLWVVRGRLTLGTDREWRVRGSVMISWHVEVGDLVDKDVGVRIVRGMTLAQIVIPWGFREKPGCNPVVFRGCLGVCRGYWSVCLGYSDVFRGYWRVFRGYWRGCRNMNQLDWILYLKAIIKISLSPFDDKRYWLTPHGVEGYSYGHYKIAWMFQQ